MTRRRVGENLKRALLITVCLAGCPALADQQCDYDIEDHARVLEGLISELIEPSDQPAINHVVWHWSDHRHEYAMVGGCVDLKVEVGIVFGLQPFGTVDDMKRHALDIAYSFMSGRDYQRLTDALNEGDHSTVGPTTVDGARFLGLFIAHPLGEIVVSRKTTDDEARFSVSWPIN